MFSLALFTPFFTSLAALLVPKAELILDFLLRQRVCFSLVRLVLCCSRGSFSLSGSVLRAHTQHHFTGISRARALSRLRHLFYKRQGEKWMSKVFSSFLHQFYEQTVARLLFFSSLGQSTESAQSKKYLSPAASRLHMCNTRATKRRLGRTLSLISSRSL